jgi:hypothetical protein
MAKPATYVDIHLNSVEDYWNGPVLQNLRAFQQEQSATSLFNAATSIWHLHDWLWHDRNPGEDTKGSGKYLDYRNRLVAASPELALLRDIADASKHKGLGRRDVKVRAAEQRIEGTPIGLTLIFTREVPRFYIVVDDETKHDALAVVLKAVEFWRTVELKDRDLPSM